MILPQVVRGLLILRPNRLRYSISIIPAISREWETGITSKSHKVHSVIFFGCFRDSAEGP